jgi:hypothetical protein
MITQSELHKALEAGAKFDQAVTAVTYLQHQDMVLFTTPWGSLAFHRKIVPILCQIDPDSLSQIRISQTGLHIDNLDLDISSAGLLAQIFEYCAGELSKSF